MKHRAVKRRSVVLGVGATAGVAAVGVAAVGGITLTARAESASGGSASGVRPFLTTPEQHRSTTTR